MRHHKSLSLREADEVVSGRGLNDGGRKCVREDLGKTVVGNRAGTASEVDAELRDGKPSINYPRKSKGKEVIGVEKYMKVQQSKESFTVSCRFARLDFPRGAKSPFSPMKIRRSRSGSTRSTSDWHRRAKAPPHEDQNKNNG